MDFEQDAGLDQLDETRLEQLAQAARQQMSLEDQIKNTKQQLKELNADLYNQQNSVIPELMALAGIKEVKLADGSAVKIDAYYSASIPSATAIGKAKGNDAIELIERADACYEYLRGAGCGDLIKREVTVTFAAGEDGAADELFNELVESGLSCSDKSAVHPGTLKSFVKDQVGVEGFPMEMFKVEIGNRAIIKRG